MLIQNEKCYFDMLDTFILVGSVDKIFCYFLFENLFRIFFYYMAQNFNFTSYSDEKQFFLLIKFSSGLKNSAEHSLISVPFFSH